MSDSCSSLTAVVVDLNPLAWGLRTVIESNHAQQQEKTNARAETIVQGLDAILTFINSFLLMTHGNQVAVIGVHPFGSGKNVGTGPFRIYLLKHGIMRRYLTRGSV